MIKRWWLFSSASIIFLLFVFFSYLVHKHIFDQFDFNMTVRLQDHLTRRFDNLFSVLSIVGQVTFTSVALFVVLLLYRTWKALWLLGLFGVIHLFELYGKSFVDHRPPPHFMLRTAEFSTNFPQFYVSEQNSYPSGHSSRAMFISTLLVFLILRSKYSPLVKGILLCLITGYVVSMLVSRVYLGEHWTSDVIGGSLIGLAMALLGVGLVENFSAQRKLRKE